MARLILSVLPLAAGAALSPVILVAALAVVSSSRSPARRMAAFTAGAALVLAALSVLALTVLHGTGASDSPPDEVGAVQLAFAAVLALLGIRTIRKPPADPGKRREEASAEPRLTRTFALGAGLMATNLTTLALYFPAVHLIGTSDTDFAAKAVAFALLFLITLLPAEIPLLASVYGRLRPALDRLSAFLSRNERRIFPAIEFGFAAYLAVLGLTKLL